MNSGKLRAENGNLICWVLLPEEAKFSNQYACLLGYGEHTTLQSCRR